uniref:Chemosensory protein 2 n=1 Tax=Oedaleus asiaticus TaxID=244712 RepID=A0A2D1AHE1_9ORTH|nr:chemosensory protein 2 [Oedaleus asiaticus]
MAGKLTVCCLLGLLALCVEAAPQDPLDSFNVDEVLSNERLLKSYIQCMLDDGEGRCTKEGKEIKKRLPQFVATGCLECTPSQLDRAIKTLKHVTEEHAEDWARLKAKYDPTGEYSRKHADTWKQRGINF